MKDMPHFLKRSLAAAASILILGTTAILPQNGLETKADTVINNASLIPRYVPDSQVKLEDGSPDWVKTLVMAEVRIETATPEGTFQSATKVLDHYAEMGVNGIWITPPYADSATYGVKYPDRLSSRLTGTSDIEAGFAVAKKFVDEAHKRNIRVFFDIVTWGTTKDSPWVTSHPEWYDNWREAYGGYVWRWSNTEWQEWFINNAVNIVMKTGIDGYRCDLEPDNTGYDVFSKVRQRLLAKGRKVAIFSEIVNYRYWQDGLTYDFEQVGVGSDESCQYHYNSYSNYFLDRGNIVDCIKSGIGIGHKTLQPTGEGGTFRYYTFCVACHDNHNTVTNGNRITMGYQAILAPFIPLWYIGEEWNNPKKMATSGTGVLFYNTIDWDKMDEPENRAFYEDIKKMIRIRRQYPDIFNYYPDNHQDTNICKVKVSGIEELGAYARFSGDTGILVVPNANIHSTAGNFKITIPFADMKLSGYKNFTVTELMTGKTVASGTREQVGTFSFTVPNQHLRVFLIKGSGGTATPTTTRSPSGSKITTRSSATAMSTSGSKATAGSGTDMSTADSSSISTDGTSDTELASGAETDDTSAAPSGDTTAAVINPKTHPSNNDGTHSDGGGLGVGWIILIVAGALLIAGGTALLVLWKLGKLPLKK